MKKMKTILAITLCLMLVIGMCGCGEKEQKAIPEYNVAAAGRTLDTKDSASVIENALLIDVQESVSVCEGVAVAFEEYSKTQKGKQTTYYLVASVGGYVYENGKLSRNYGNAPFAAVITLKESNGIYEVVDFKAGRNLGDEVGHESFVAENFPKGTTVEELFKDRAGRLFEAEKQQLIEKYGFAEEEFSTGDEIIELLPVTNYAYYTLVEYFPMYPDYPGSVTRIEDGVRYTYTTSYVGEDGGKGVVSYVKTDDEGVEAERYDINVNGDEVEIPEGLYPPGEEYIEEDVDAAEEDEEAAEETNGEEISDSEIEEEDPMAEFDYDDGLEYTLVD